MPYGEFQYSVDDKGRVIVPPSFREFVEDGMVVTRGMDGCLFVFPLGKWTNIESILEGKPLTDFQIRKFTRFFYSGAQKARIDSAGRITIPATLRGYAEIDGNVIVAGAPNRLEIWNEARWNQFLNETENDPLAPGLLSELVG